MCLRTYWNESGKNQRRRDFLFFFIFLIDFLYRHFPTTDPRFDPQSSFIFTTDCLEDLSGWEIGKEESQRYCRGFKMLISKEMGHSAKEVLIPW
jgi:hypothetical protein